MAYRMYTTVMAAGAAFLAAPLAADVKTGVDAWSAGDFGRAVNEWKLPAENGDADALFNLAQAYRLGRGVPADVSRARELYAEAAQRGHVKAADNYGLLLFQQGEQQIAMPLIIAAAERGDPRAQYVLGLAHFNADFAKKDWPRAYALLTLAQGAGLPQAAGALKQMDQYVPMEQRQQAQLLAREIEAEAGRVRAAQLAAADLAVNRGASAPPPVGRAPAPAAAPVRMAASTPARAPAPVAASRTPAPAPAYATRPMQLSSAPAPVRSAPTPAPAARPAPRKGNWGVQLGAFGVRANADRLWSKVSSNPALSGTSKSLVSAGRVTRLRAVGFASRVQAERACITLKRQGQACIVAKP